MKKLLILALFFISFRALSEESCDIKQNNIKKCVNGACTTYSNETHVVVKRRTKCDSEVLALKAQIEQLKQENEALKAKKPEIKEVIVNKEVIKTKFYVLKAKPKLNNIQLGLGYGMVGLVDRSNTSEAYVAVNYGLVGSIAYSRLINKEGLNLGGQLLTNKTLLFTVGQDF